MRHAARRLWRGADDQAVRDQGLPLRPLPGPHRHCSRVSSRRERRRQRRPSLHQEGPDGLAQGTGDSGSSRASQPRNQSRRCGGLVAAQDSPTDAFPALPQDYRTWYRAEQELSTSSEQMDWVFGAEGPISANMVQRQGYALRVKCETHGSDRRVLIGVERADRPVVWSALDDCRLTPDGLVTPALEELLSDDSAIQRGKGAWLRPATFPLRADQIVFAIDTKAPAPKHSPLAAEGRYIITADVKPAGSRIIRAHVSLPDDVPMPGERYVYRLYGVARLLLTDPDPRDGVQWAVRADGVVQLGGIEAERTGLWRPGIALPQRVGRASDVPVPPSAPPRSRPLPYTAESAQRNHRVVLLPQGRIRKWWSGFAKRWKISPGVAPQRRGARWELLPNST